MPKRYYSAGGGRAYFYPSWKRRQMQSSSASDAEPIGTTEGTPGACCGHPWIAHNALLGEDGRCTAHGCECRKWVEATPAGKDAA